MVGLEGAKMPEGVATPQAGDNRRHARVALPLRVRYQLPDKSEFVGKILNISANGAMIRARRNVEVGQTILLYIEKVGRFEAAVVRVEKDGFAVSLQSRKARCMRTADTLTWLLNGGEEMHNRRRADRVRQNKQASLRLANGEERQCLILDISTSGASVGIEDRPPIGERIMLGRMQAQVVRHHKDGVGVVFSAAPIGR